MLVGIFFNINKSAYTFIWQTRAIHYVSWGYFLNCPMKYCGTYVTEKLVKTQVHKNRIPISRKDFNPLWPSSPRLAWANFN